MKRFLLLGALALSCAAFTGPGFGNVARADVQREDFRIEADLLEASARGDSARVGSLLKMGAKIETRDPSTTWTPLMWAARGGHLATVRLLLARGARVNARSVGSAAAYVSLAMGQQRAVALEGQAEDVQPLSSEFRSANNGVTPLMLACVGGFNLSARELIRRGADVNARTSSGETALEAAAWSGSVPLVEALLARGANVNARNAQGATPLLAAVKEGRSPVVKLLLARGANANANAGVSQGYSSLSLARYFGFKDIERLLRRAGATTQASAASSRVNSNSGKIAAGRAPRAVSRPSLPRPARPASSGGTRSGAPAASGPNVIILN
jgi:ankyrin repeat protein